MTYQQYRLEKIISYVLQAVATLGAVVWIGLPFLIWAGQILDWLRESFWTPFTARTMMEAFSVPVPQVDWQGVQKLINFIVGLPAAVVILLLGWALGSWLMALMEGHSRDLDLTEREHPE